MNIEDLIETIKFETECRRRQNRNCLTELRKFGAEQRVYSGVYDTEDSRPVLKKCTLEGLTQMLAEELLKVLSERHKVQYEWIKLCNQTVFVYNPQQLPVDEYTPIIKKLNETNNTTSMDEKHISEHLNRPERQFNFKDKVTYIERQDITVQSGANFYNGPANGETVMEPTPDKLMSPEDKIRYCICKLEEDVDITTKQDYGAVLFAIQEKDIKYFTDESFARFVSNIEKVPAAHKPNENSFKAVRLVNPTKNQLPNWRLTGEKTDSPKTKHFNQIGSKFLDIYNRLGKTEVNTK